ncbi:hypothetical protein DER46DRAFT_588391 [Fusarium sp. MPI-SDFR-AT-0072]|nr:hypothetical protein DER46DRAFT_588391 [Fusarium sp. MPI-SDFR-AT-0072]
MPTPISYYYLIRLLPLLSFSADFFMEFDDRSGASHATQLCPSTGQGLERFIQNPSCDSNSFYCYRAVASEDRDELDARGW